MIAVLMLNSPDARQGQVLENPAGSWGFTPDGVEIVRRLEPIAISPPRLIGSGTVRLPGKLSIKSVSTEFLLIMEVS